MLDERIVLEAECRAITGLARTTRFELERKGKFPQRRLITGRKCGWLYTELVEWMRSREAGFPRAPEAALRARGVQRLPQ